MEKNIVIKGACENNLQDLDVTIPRDRLVVFTGLSGSGKSSLAFDTIYAREPEEIRGKPVCLCQTVFGIDEKAGCEGDEGPFSGYFH